MMKLIVERGTNRDRDEVVTAVLQSDAVSLLDPEDEGTTLLRNVGNHPATRRHVPEHLNSYKNAASMLKRSTCVVKMWEF
jgi:hypothetical protein